MTKPPSQWYLRFIKWKFQALVLVICVTETAYAQLSNFLLCPCNNWIKGQKKIEVQCEYYPFILQNRIDSIWTDSDTVFIDAWDSLPYRPVVNLSMRIVAETDTSSGTLEGDIYYIYEKDTIFWGRHHEGLAEGKAMFAFQGDTTLGYFIKGSLEGIVTNVSPDSTKMVVQYKSGKRHGIQYSFYPNGRVRSFTEFRNGVQHGTEAKFHENGFPKYMISFKNGKIRNGTYYAYNDDGTVYMIIKGRKGQISEQRFLKPLDPFLLD